MDQSIGYTREVGRKFHPDGSARLFPGNTVICFAAASEPLYQAAVGLQDRLRTTSYGHRFALLPPPSFHMTVIELLCDQVREQGNGRQRCRLMPRYRSPMRTFWSECRQCRPRRP
ncbi:MAG: DUF1868 domain-containing protein [Oscillochloris sp.]|nr:DUF1868 domain-containing protein [Oscillochloris sp.]